eukprot:6230716-Amphidinium_carterae.1
MRPLYPPRHVFVRCTVNVEEGAHDMWNHAGHIDGPLLLYSDRSPTKARRPPDQGAGKPAGEDRKPRASTADQCPNKSPAN